jgi:hypothetical protein
MDRIQTAERRDESNADDLERRGPRIDAAFGRVSLTL